MATPRLWNDEDKLNQMVEFLTKLDGKITRIDFCKEMEIDGKQFTDKVKIALLMKSGDLTILDKIYSAGIQSGGATRKNPMLKSGKNLVIPKWNFSTLDIPDGQRFQFSYDKKKKTIVLTPTDEEFV